MDYGTCSRKGDGTMYRETQIKLKPGQPKELLKTKLEKKYSVNIKEWKIVRESLDARNKRTYGLYIQLILNVTGS